MEEKGKKGSGLVASIKVKLNSLFPGTGSLTKYYIVFGVVALIAIALGAIYFVLSSNLQKQQKVETAPKEQKENVAIPYTPPPGALATGTQTYEISGSNPGAPKIARATVDPIDPAKGTNQTWRAEILGAENGPVTEANVSIFTDNGNERYSLKLTEGTNTNGTWQGSFQLKDTYDHTYVAVLRAKNEAGKIHKVDLVLR